jgi:Ca2+-binding RTX toxin-like protein
MTNFVGTGGADNYAGTGGDDTFDMTQGGRDTVLAGGGDDQIDFGAGLTGSDRIDGGDGFDILSIQGDYRDGLTLNRDTLHGIERLQFLAGFSYRLTLVDGNIDPTTQLDLSNDHGAKSIWVDASAIVNGGTVSTYSWEKNTIIGTQSGDSFQEFTTAFNLDGQGGVDHVDAFSGFAANSRFDGGDGDDSMSVGTAFSGTLSGAALRHVETLTLQFASDITFADGNVGARETMTVLMNVGSRADASAETAGRYVFNGSSDADTIIGGRGADTVSGGQGDDQITGGRGADSLIGDTGADSFIFTATADSTNRAHDLITDFDAAEDHIDLSAIDARTDRANDQAFHLVAKFTGVSGQLTLTYDADDDVTLVRGDVNGDGRADLYIDVSGHLTDTAGFVL